MNTYYRDKALSTIHAFSYVLNICMKKKLITILIIINVTIKVQKSDVKIESMRVKLTRLA